MAYSETRIVIGGLAHVPKLILIVNFMKSKFEIKNEQEVDNVVKEEQEKIIEVKDTVVIQRKTEDKKNYQISWIELKIRLSRFLKR